MKTINEYLLEISSNNEILNIISEVLDEDNLLTEEEIEKSFEFINEEKEQIFFNPETNSQLNTLLEQSIDNDNCDAFNAGWRKWIRKNNIKDKVPVLIWHANNTTDIPSIIISNIIISQKEKNTLSLSQYNKENDSIGKPITEIKYNYNKDIFYNILHLLSENKIIFYQFISCKDDIRKYKFKFNESELSDYKEINFDDILKIDSKISNSNKDVKNKVIDSIKDNKDLLTPLAKEANITGEKLRDIITKVCLDKKGKPRKLDESVILGLSIMLCGVILTIKKSGKSDNNAILAVTDKITSIVKNKKSIKNTI